MRKTVRFLAIILLLATMHHNIFGGGFLDKVKGKVESALEKKKLPSENDYKKLVLRLETSIAEYHQNQHQIYDTLLRATTASTPEYNTIKAMYEEGKKLENIVKDIIKRTISLDNAEEQLRKIVTLLDKQMQELKNRGTNSSRQSEILNAIAKFKSQLRSNADNLIVQVQRKKMSEGIAGNISPLLPTPKDFEKISLDIKTKAGWEYKGKFIEVERKIYKVALQKLSQSEYDNIYKMMQNISRQREAINDLLTELQKKGQNLSKQDPLFKRIDSIKKQLIKLEEQIGFAGSDPLKTSLQLYVRKLEENLKSIEDLYFSKK